MKKGDDRRDQVDGEREPKNSENRKKLEKNKNLSAETRGPQCAELNTVPTSLFITSYR
ncbi:hypothetical protein G5I_11015 [Acromyrmex echinatior]|uniref:Uncharacterized protein n=1 Tax=Acromyrmex echinatior TaxID=103372 RepID=F4WYG5_ACREC|nr:hypothetical protein G5I_11015 [Acromyrmex echinatior]